MRIIFISGSEYSLTRTASLLGVPGHWSPDCKAAREDLQHLYLARRLIELRRRPGLNLYRKLKPRVFPVNTHNELRSTIQNGIDRKKFLLSLFDIFPYEGDNASIEALMNDGLLNATGLRYHDAIIHFGVNPKASGGQRLWAIKQATTGFAKSLGVLTAAIHKEFPNIAGAYDMSDADTERNAANGLAHTATKESIGTLFINRSRCMPDSHDWKKLPKGEEPATTGSSGRSLRFLSEGGSECLWKHATAWGETAKKFLTKPELQKELMRRMADILAEKCGPFVLWNGLAAEYLVAA
jgi:hypothetical protein